MRTSCGPQQAQHICEKELRFLKLPVEGLSAYYSPKEQAIKLNQCERVPSIIYGKVQPQQTVKCLSKLPSNNIMVAAMVILQLAFRDKRDQALLNRVKRYAYDEELHLVELLEVSERGRYNEQVIKKLFVEFFHLVASNNYKNKVEKFMYKYPIMQCVFILLFRKILLLQGVTDAGNLQLPVPTSWVVENLCKALEIRYELRGNGVYDISGVLLAQDSCLVYKVCESEQHHFEKTIQTEEQKLFRLLDDSFVESEVLKFPNLKLQYSRPQTPTQRAMFKKQSTRSQSSSCLFSNNRYPHPTLKRAESNLPLTFSKIKNKSQVFTPEVSSVSYMSTQASNTYVLPQRQLGNQWGGVNLLNIQNNNYHNVFPPVQRQNSHHELAQYKYSTFSPSIRVVNPEVRLKQVSQTTNPLVYYTQPLQKRIDDSWHRKQPVSRMSTVEAYRYDGGSRQYRF